MASLAVAAVGASIGGAFIPTIFGVSGTAIGWAIGSFLGSTLFGPSGQDVQGPRLEDLKVQSSAYGAPIPIVYGKARISGNVIWAKPIRERKIEEDAGGKGGGGSTVTTYEYYGSFAVGLCDNEIAGVRKIWADSVLIYDAGNTASLETIQASNRQAENITIYLGTETQEADSLIQADKGAANTQAYRGTAYIVFDDLLLEKYGNRIPNITAEVLTSGSKALRLVDTQDISVSGATFNHVASYWDHKNGFLTAFVGDWTNTYVTSSVKVVRHYANGLIEDQYSESIGGTGGTYNPCSTFSNDGAYCAFGGGAVATPQRFRVYFASEAGLVRANFTLSNSNTFSDSVSECCVYGDFAYLLSKSNAQVRSIQKFNLLNGRQAASLGIWASGETLCTSSTTLSTVPHAIAIEDDVIYVLNTNNTITKFDLDGGLIGSLVLSFSPSITYATIGGPSDPQIRVRDGKIYILGDTRFFSCDLDGSNLVYHGAPSSLSGVNPSFAQGGTDFADGVFHQYRTDLSQTATYKYRAYSIDSLSAGTVTLSNIVSDIDERAGLDAADDDTTALTDTVEGYVVTRPMSARKAIEPLQQAFFFDAAEIDNVLTYIKRGGSVTASIPEVDLGAGDYGQDVDLYTQTRQQDSELPAEIVVDYIDLNRSYEEGAQRAQRINSPQENVVKMQLPIVMTANYAKEIAHVLLYNAHVEREKFSLSLTNEYIDLNPTDVINFTVGSDTRKARITKITYGDTLQLDLLAEDSTIYSADVVAGDSEENDQIVGLEGPTKLYLMDIPLLRNQDNDAGLYVAGSGYFSGWTGASIFKSLDGGVSYAPVNDVLAASVMGKATTVLPSKAHTTFDYTSSVTVSLTSGTLSSSTESAVIQGANYALLGTEIIQFVNATDNGDGTYTLSTLLRGRRGTDWAVGTHAVGDLFCLLRENVLERVGAIVNTERYYKAVTFGTFLDEATAQAKTNTGVSQKPFSVKYIAGTRDGSNNLSITWTRRSRYIGTPLWTPPVFEDSQSYRVEILDAPAGSVINTYTATTPAYTYTAAQQTADGLTPGNTVYVNIYQVGAVNGYETEATL